MRVPVVPVPQAAPLVPAGLATGADRGIGEVTALQGRAGYGAVDGSGFGQIAARVGGRAARWRSGPASRRPGAVPASRARTSSGAGPEAASAIKGRMAMAKAPNSLAFMENLPDFAEPRLRSFSRGGSTWPLGLVPAQDAPGAAHHAGFNEADRPFIQTDHLR